MYENERVFCKGFEQNRFISRGHSGRMYENERVSFSLLDHFLIKKLNFYVFYFIFLCL